MHRTPWIAALAVSSLSLGCVGTGDPESTPSEYAISLPPDQSALVLALVSYPGVDADELDHAAGIDTRAAHNIVAYRNGPDGLCPSSDDITFTSVAELDAVPYVGDATFRSLVSYAVAHPAPRGETVEGVAFAGWQVEAVVWGVGHATLAELDALLDGRAARALIAARPFSTVAQMGPVSYVGASALTQLRNAANGWWSAMNMSAPALAGTFDSVVFDEATATTALAIANEATSAQLTAHGMASAAASAILGNRPFATLAAVSATGGVGTATMNALKSYAQSGAWGQTATCDFDAAVRPHLGDLLFLSESDREITVVSFPGAGASAPTAASVLALAMEEAGTTAQLRSVADYYVALEPSSDMADPNAAAAIEAAVAANLSDVIYVAISLPRSDPYHAEVRVYLVGRTACGDLVGLRSIAVET
jgi:DNA uptake protein ComE-like DNA-binding protein